MTMMRPDETSTSFILKNHEMEEKKFLENYKSTALTTKSGSKGTIITSVNGHAMSIGTQDTSMMDLSAIISGDKNDLFESGRNDMEFFKNFWEV